MWLRLFAGLLAFATPSMAQMAPGGVEAAKPWLGVAIDKGDKGVLVKDVLDGTPAKEAGIKAADQITAVDTVKVKEPDELIKAVQEQGVGNTVTVHFLRAGKAEERKVKLVARPDQLEVVRQKLVGKQAPDFDLNVIHGKGPGSTKALKGKVTVVEFWATWCPACRSTHARLSDYAKKHDVNVVAVSDEETEALKSYAAAKKPAFSILQDSSHATTSQWMVSAIPELAVLDKDGKVIFATIGAGDYLEEALAAADKASGKAADKVKGH